ncbi:Blp family class II bacteriocin [Streptococcus ferus]
MYDMTTTVCERFDVMDNESLSAVKGGLSDCALGILSTGGLGAVGGPGG